MKPRVKFFCQSIVSDWNHGNAHFLRGILSEFSARGCEVESLEPEDSWSRLNLMQECGAAAVCAFEQRYPQIPWRTYDLKRDDIAELIDGADLVIVHEWNTPELVSAVGEYRRRNRHARVFFHDTHHRAVTSPADLNLERLGDYDGILVYGQALKERYAQFGWKHNVHVWHEAADTRVFKPIALEKTGDLAWIGNWGDDERTEELEEFLLRPAENLNVKLQAYGVRYPPSGIARLEQAGFAYCGWLANYRAPEVFARHRVTIHVPRRPYLTALPGIPTIRPFEAMACGIPLIIARWRDTEGLFREGRDYLSVMNGAEAERGLRDILHDQGLSRALSKNGMETILNRHTCAHRVTELLDVFDSVSGRQEVEVCG